MMEKSLRQFECLNKTLYSTLIIVACRAMMLQELFLYSQTCVNRLLTVLPALTWCPCGLIISPPMTIATLSLNVIFSMFLSKDI